MQLKHLWNNVLQVVYLPAFKLANPVIPFSTLPQYPTRMMWIVTSIAYCLLYLMETWPTAWTLTGSEQMVIISSHLICPLTVRVVGAPQMTSQPVPSIFHCSPMPSETWQTPGLSHSLTLSSNLFFCLPCFLPPFTVPCKMVLARPDEQDTCLYHCSLHLFTMVRRSSCGLIISWILARTSSLVTWSL